MGKVLLYIHGKGGSAQEAERYRILCEGYQICGLDYHGETPWETKGEILAAFDSFQRGGNQITLIANSIGAFFAMNALKERTVFQACFISPIVDMEALILAMMARSHVTEAELKERGEIQTASGDTLSWAYLQYVRSHPISWTVPTHILYGERDFLTSMETIQSFARCHQADLTVMEGGEHWFHTPEELAFHDAWVRRYL